MADPLRDGLQRVQRMIADGAESQAYLDGVHDGSIVALFPPEQGAAGPGAAGSMYGRRFVIRPAWLEDSRYGATGRHDAMAQRLVERVNQRGHNAVWRPWPTLPDAGDPRADGLARLADLRAALERMTYPDPLRLGEKRNVADHVAHRHLEALEHIIRSTLTGPALEPLLFDRPHPPIEEPHDDRD